MEKFYRGDTFSKVLTIHAAYEGGNITDMTGWTGVAKINDVDGVEISVLTFEWIDAAQCIAQAKSNSETSDWSIGEASLFIRLTSPSGQECTITPLVHFVIVMGI